MAASFLLKGVPVHGIYYMEITHTPDSYSENENTRREEVKKRLQIEAFQKINESITLFSEIVTKVTTPYRTILVNVNLWKVYNPSFIVSEVEKNKL
jgi:hypothetical protein